MQMCSHILSVKGTVPLQDVFDIFCVTGVVKRADSAWRTLPREASEKLIFEPLLLEKSAGYATSAPCTTLAAGAPIAHLPW